MTKEQIEKEILTPETEREIMFQALREGRTKGTTTYMELVDPLWTWRNGETNLVTGYANEGKSTFLKQTCLIKALEEKKKFVFYAPEDYPASEFFDDMIHTISGQTTDKHNPNQPVISEELYAHCLNLIEDLFIFLYIKPPDNTIEEIVSSAEDLLEADSDITGLVIDPYIKVTRSRKAPDRDDLYGAYFLNILGNFSRTKSINSFLVMHQQTPKVNEQGLYPKPNKYAIKSGGTFSDTADNVMSMWRPHYAKDKINPQCMFFTEKIKKQKLVGVPGDQMIDFDRRTNRYCYPGTNQPLYNWDKWLPSYKPLKTFL